MTRLAPILIPFALAAAALGAGLAAQSPLAFDDANDARAALVTAQAQGTAASRRAAELEAAASSATQAADRTAHEAAGLAARVQQAEAAIAGNEARIRLIAGEQTALRTSLAERERPVVRLTGALQRIARRPMALSLLRPGSLQDTTHLRALLETMLPEVERRTAALKQDIARSHVLQQRAEATRATLRNEQVELDRRRQSLAALETGQRLASREASGVADREAERALALAEQSRDLGALASRLGEAGALRAQLAALPGPVQRPARPDLAQVVDPATASASPSEMPSGLAGYMLPVDGRLVAGFGEVKPGIPASRGIALAPRGAAQAVAPAAGRVVFAGPYRGYGAIVIIEHAGGWTSLITGLAQLSVRVGDDLVSGSPLGTAAPVRPVLTVELRRNGEPVNPLDQVQP
jgi:murein hydrolase activator